MTQCARRPTRGLTLLEVVISITLITMLVGALLTFYFGSLNMRQQAAAIADRTEVARLVLSRIAAELRGCLGTEQFGFPVEPRLTGDRRSIHFVTTALPADEQYQFYSEFDTLPPGQHDLVELSYMLHINPDEETEDGDPVVEGLLRVEKKTLNQFLVDEEDPEQLRHDLWSPELHYLEFRYFDGVEWTTTWDLEEGNPLPQLVQVTVGFDPLLREEYEDQDLTTYPIADYPLGDDQVHPDRYSIIVRIPAADRFFSSRLQRVGKEFGEQLGVEGNF
ncbi:MAG: prepilin-type N-terminal cleavage/methylation domain-containing protein [Phycisphaerae bacterium]|jgi:type II secretory pathway pseudopilin PulG